MAYSRTITVIDHEVTVRIVEIPDEAPAAPFTAITGGRATAAYTAAAALLVAALALFPAITVVVR